MSQQQEDIKQSIEVECIVHESLKEIVCNPAEIGNIARNNPRLNMTEKQLRGMYFLPLINGVSFKKPI